LEIGQIEEIHVGRGIERAQGAVDINRAGLERHAQALAEHHLKHVAGADVVLALFNGSDEALAGEAGDEVGLAQGIGRQHVRVAGTAVAQPVDQRIQSALGAGPGLRLGRVGVDDEVQAALEVVEHRHFFAQHEEDVGRVELIGQHAAVGQRAGQTRLDVTDALEAEVADQAAGERRQAVDFGHRVGGAQTFDLAQRVGHVAGFDQLAEVAHFQAVAAEGVAAPCRQADDRMPAPGLAAFNGLEQIGLWAVGQLEVDRKRGVQIGQDLAHHRDAGVAFGGESGKGGGVGHGGVGCAGDRRVCQRRRGSGRKQAAPPAVASTAGSGQQTATGVDLGAHPGDDFGVVGSAKDRRAGHEGIGAGGGDGGDVVGLDATVDFQPNRLAASIDHRAHPAQLVQRGRNEGLAAEAGVDRHQQHQVQIVEQPLQGVQRCRRIEHQPGLAALGLDQLQRAVDVAAGFGVEADQAGAGSGEIGHDAVDRLDHQMHVDWRTHAMLSQRLANQRTDGQIGYVMVVHHVKVDPVCASGQGGVDVITQRGKIGRQDGWGDDRLQRHLLFLSRWARRCFWIAS